MENKPGNGSAPPFGNGGGATSGGAASGAHDFLTDPKSGSPATGGRDFTKESRPQKPSGPPGSACPPNPSSIPAGGLLPQPLHDPGPKGAEGTAVQPLGAKPPFRLNGGG